MNYIDDDHMSSELMSSVHFSDTHYAAVGRETVKETTTGRWTAEEHQLFLEGLRQHKKQWKLIADLIKTRTVVQIRTHAQKYFQKLLKSNKTDDFEDLFIQELANGSGNKSYTDDSHDTEKSSKQSNRARAQSTSSTTKSKKLKTEHSTKSVVQIKSSVPSIPELTYAPVFLNNRTYPEIDEFDISADTTDWLENSTFAVHGSGSSGHQQTDFFLSLDCDENNFQHFDDLDIAWLCEITAPENKVPVTVEPRPAGLTVQVPSPQPIKDIWHLSDHSIDSKSESESDGSMSPKANPRQFSYDKEDHMMFPQQRVGGGNQASSRKRGRPRRSFSADDVREISFYPASSDYSIDGAYSSNEVFALDTFIETSK